VVVPAEVRRAVEEHAREEQPNEACGLIAFRDGVAERYLPAINEAASPYRFELKPRDPLDFYLEDDGFELGVVHSHLSSPAYPSRTDVENIGLWAGKPYLIYSLGKDELAAFTIEDGQISGIAIN
jgi:proteasome lid subunit RPN8/RPN11